jgi:hypothetical protein
MATVAAIVPIKINTFSDGTDTYLDLRQLRYQENPLPEMPYRPEGSLRPTAHYPVASNTPRFQGTITGSSAALKALGGTTKTTCTIDGTNANGNAALTITMSNVTFKAFSGGADENPSQETPQSITFIATDIAVANDA